MTDLLGKVVVACFRSVDRNGHVYDDERLGIITSQQHGCMLTVMSITSTPPDDDLKVPISFTDTPPAGYNEAVYLDGDSSIFRGLTSFVHLVSISTFTWGAVWNGHYIVRHPAGGRSASLRHGELEKLQLLFASRTFRLNLPAQPATRQDPQPTKQASQPQTPQQVQASQAGCKPSLITKQEPSDDDNDGNNNSKSNNSKSNSNNSNNRNNRSRNNNNNSNSSSKNAWAVAGKGGRHKGKVNNVDDFSYLFTTIEHIECSELTMLSLRMTD